MRDCWIDPNGKIHEVQYQGHNQFAEEFLEKEMQIEEFRKYRKDTRKYPYEILHEQGWVRVKYNSLKCFPKVFIMGGCLDLTKPMRNTIDPAMNSRQMRVAKLICEEVGEDFHKAINDKRFW